MKFDNPEFLSLLPWLSGAASADAVCAAGSACSADPVDSADAVRIAGNACSSDSADAVCAVPDFSRMISLYRQWNEKINVISRKDIDNVFEHHILHSLCIAFYLAAECPDELELWKRGGISVLDLGCGGGFPGIPLASVFPNVEFTLCDSIGKKVTVASEVAKSLGLNNVHCVHSRAEQLPGQWDYVVSRAVTSLDNFLPWVEGRYRRGILYLKGGDMTGELDACRRKYGPAMPSVRTWNIENVLKDEYYKEKLVVNLGIWQK